MKIGRQPAIISVLVILVVASGCVGFISGNEALSYAASEGSVSATALEETGYEHNRTTAATVNRTFEAAGQSREVSVSNHQAEYYRTIDFGFLGGKQKAAVFVAFTTPKVQVLGSTYNPVGEMSNRELVSQLQSQFNALEIGQQTGSDTVSTLGTEATVDRFDGQARIGGTSLDVYVHVTKIEHGEDYVIAVGVHPQQLSGEGENILRLVSGLEHDE